MSEIAEQFETASASQPVFQLWWVVGSILEGLRQRGLDGSVSIKRLLGQVDRELSRRLDHRRGFREHATEANAGGERANAHRDNGPDAR